MSDLKQLRKDARKLNEKRIALIENDLKKLGIERNKADRELLEYLHDNPINADPEIVNGFVLAVVNAAADYNSKNDEINQMMEDCQEMWSEIKRLEAE